MTEKLYNKQRPGRDRKRRVIKKGRLLLVGLVFCVLIFGFIWYLVGGIKALVYKQLVDINTLQPGTVSKQLVVEGVLIKQEYLITAPLKGTMKYSAANGQRVKTGTVIGTITAPSMESASGTKQYAVTASTGGVFSNKIDGLETILVPGAMDVVEIPSLDKIENKDHSVEISSVEKGQPVAKVVDNLSPMFIYCLLPEADVKVIQSQKQSIIRLQWQGQNIEAKVDKTLSGKQPGIIFVLKNYPDDLVYHRLINFSLTTDVLEGMLVPEKSLVTRDNQVGIFLVWKGLIRWVPVEVEGRLKGQAAIKGTGIEPGVRYILNPKFAREGDRL